MNQPAPYGYCPICSTKLDKTFAGIACPFCNWPDSEIETATVHAPTTAPENDKDEVCAHVWREKELYGGRRYCGNCYIDEPAAAPEQSPKTTAKNLIDKFVADLTRTQQEGLPYKGPINIPCSACSAGDFKMEHHNHDYVKPENRRTQQGAEPRCLINPPVCEKHKVVMMLSFYDRPGSPQGNCWVCPSCMKEREAAPSQAAVESEDALLPLRAEMLDIAKTIHADDDSSQAALACFIHKVTPLIRAALAAQRQESERYWKQKAACGHPWACWERGKLVFDEIDVLNTEKSVQPHCLMCDALAAAESKTEAAVAEAIRMCRDACDKVMLNTHGWAPPDRYKRTIDAQVDYAAVAASQAQREQQLRLEARKPLVDIMLEINSLVQFASRCEIESPSTHQEFAREAEERLARWDAALRAELAKVKGETK